MKELLISEHTPRGKIEVRQKGSVCSLYLTDDTAIQSQLDLEQRQKLLKQYNRAMMSFILFKPQAKSLLLFGLGGGVMLHFLDYWFPDLSIEVVEINGRVIELARQYFKIPDTAQIKIHNSDAEQFFTHKQTRALLDVIIIDLHDGRSLPPFLLKPQFLSQCHQALSHDGIIVFNLLIEQEQDFLPIMLAMRESFNGISLCLSLKNEQNIIVLAFKSLQSIDMPALRQKASHYQQQYDIEFEQFVDDMSIVEAR